MFAILTHSGNRRGLRSVLGLLLLGAIALSVSAQPSYPQHRLSVDVLGWRFDRFAAEYEVILKPSWGIALQGMHISYPRSATPFVVGQQVAYFGLVRSDTFWAFASSLIGSSGWQYMDEREALPLLPERIAESTVGGMATLVSVQPLRRGVWELLLRPGIFGGYHSYYQVSSALLPIDELKRLHYDNAIRIQQHLVIYEQRRTIERHNAWFGGVCAQAALRWTPLRFLAVELRGGGFMNARTPYSGARGAPIAPLFAQGSLWVGVALARKAQPPPVASEWVWSDTFQR